MKKKREFHGDTHHSGWRAPEYTVWVAMKQRCCNPRAAGYVDYGGRGIKVCRKWLCSYVAFLKDMGRRPSPLHSIHRKDNDGDYTPTNCVWALSKEQARAKRSNNNITAFGRTRCITDWAADLGIVPSAIIGRLKNGWVPEDAVSIPSTKADDKARILTVGKDSMRLPAWSAISGIAATTIWHRISVMGWEHEKAIFTPIGEAPVGRKPIVFLKVGAEKLTVEEWGKRNGLKRTTIDERLKRGWNVKDAVSMAVGVRTGCGAANGNARLTFQQVKRIKAAVGTKSDRQLAREFEVSKTTISAIRKGLTWRD